MAGPHMPERALVLLLALLAAVPRAAQSGDQVLLVVTQNDAASREIAAYYRPRRSIHFERNSQGGDNVENPFGQAALFQAIRDRLFNVVQIHGPLDFLVAGGMNTADVSGRDGSARTVVCADFARTCVILIDHQQHLVTRLGGKWNGGQKRQRQRAHSHGGARHAT